jgi:hypothetical protein
MYKEFYDALDKYYGSSEINYDREKILREINQHLDSYEMEVAREKLKKVLKEYLEVKYDETITNEIINAYMLRIDKPLHIKCDWGVPYLE